MESTVQRLADVPGGSARIYLEEAKIPGRSPEQVRQSLEFAAHKLHDAIPAAPNNSMSRADARLMLATVYAVLGDKIASCHHAENADKEAREAGRLYKEEQGKFFLEAPLIPWYRRTLPARRNRHPVLSGVQPAPAPPAGTVHMIPALAAVFSKLNGLTCFLAPLLPTPRPRTSASRSARGSLLSPMTPRRYQPRPRPAGRRAEAQDKRNRRSVTVA